jgi:hypothetical protein
MAVANAQIANQPNDLAACDDDGDGIAIFDLTITEPEILGAQDPSEFSITFYISQSDAINSTNPIVSPTVFYNNANPQAIYVRLEANSNGNFDTTSFALLVIPLPSPVTPTPLEVCDDDGDGFAAFNLTDKDSEIAGGDPDVVISYYETLVDAEIGVLPVPSPYVNIVPFNQTLYARVESGISGCYAIVPLELVVLDGCPIIDTDPVDLFINEGDNDGSAIFDLTVNESQMLGSQDPLVYLFSYHETQEDSMDGVNAFVNPTAYQNIANPQTIYVRLTNSNNGSYVLTSFLIETDGVLNINENSLIDLKLYPNPVMESVTLQSQFLTSESTVTIFNLQGREVFSEVMTAVNGKIVFSLSELNSGLYILKLTSVASTSTQKFIKY